MTPKKLIAITIIMVMFITFFEIGLFLIYEEEPTILYQEKLVEVPVEVYVFNTTPDSILTYGVGVHEDNDSGELVGINISIQPGEGRVLFDSTLHAYGTDLQDSIPGIINYVEKHTQQLLTHKDITIKLYSIAHTIEGTSGGAAIGIGLIALIQNKTIPENILITGTLDERGRIGSIAGLDAKIRVAEEMGIKRMLIPNSQCNGYNETTEIEIICVKNMIEVAEQMLV